MWKLLWAIHESHQTCKPLQILGGIERDLNETFVYGRRDDGYICLEATPEAFFDFSDVG